MELSISALFSLTAHAAQLRDQLSERQSGASSLSHCDCSFRAMVERSPARSFGSTASSSGTASALRLAAYLASNGLPSSSLAAFEDDAEPGVMMAGITLLGASCFQEIAPDVGMDTAVNVKMDATLETPSGTFEDCLVTFETTPLEPNAKDWKVYAPGVGLIIDAGAELVDVVFP